MRVNTGFTSCISFYTILDFSYAMFAHVRFFISPTSDTTEIYLYLYRDVFIVKYTIMLQNTNIAL